MRKIKLLTTFSICFVIILMLVGCNILDNLVTTKDGSAPLENILQRAAGRDTVGNATPVISQPPQGSQTVNLYFSDQKGQKLVIVGRTIPKTLSLARETVNQWLLGPADGVSDSFPAVNPKTILRDINIKNGIATVDLSKEFLEPYSNLSPQTTLYGLVNTLGQFSTVQIVKIRVEGQEIKTFRGISLDNLRAREDLVAFSSGSTSQTENQTKDEPNQTSNQNQSDNQSVTEKSQAGPTEDESPNAINLFEN